MLLLCTILATRAAAPFVGERLVWEVRYAGVTAGTAWVEVEDAPGGGLRIVGGVQNAPWYASLYRIDDDIVSNWVPGEGSSRYQTRFREGGFWQDQDMRLGPEGVVVWRHQRFDAGSPEEAWREWTDHYAWTPGSEDPVTAIYALRLGPPPWRFPVFSGSETWELIADEVDRQVLDVPALGGEVAVREVALHTAHRGQLEQRGRFRIWLSADARAVPVKMVVRTNFGPITARLIEYRAPPTGSP